MKIPDKIKPYLNLDRLDVLYGLPILSPVFPCQKCHSDKCEGKKKCKGFGSYRLGVSTK